MDIWVRDIHPKLPSAELHIFSSPKTYREHGDGKLDKMNTILHKASKLKQKGIILRNPLAKENLAKELGNFRALLYRGDEGETYCLAIGESQASGVPCVIQDVGCVAERVIDGVTGFVAKDDQKFAELGIQILQMINYGNLSIMQQLNIKEIGLGIMQLLNLKNLYRKLNLNNSLEL